MSICSLTIKIVTLSAKNVFDEAKAGDAVATALVDKLCAILACALTHVAATVDPQVFVIGGGVCNEGDPLLLPMKEIVAKEVYTRNSPKNTEIVIAKLGNDAGIIGAAMLGV